MNQIIELPTSQEIELAKQSSRTLAKYANQDRVTLKITGEDGQSEDITLPGHIMAMLLKISTEMSQGKAISLIPINAELTTQEAANMMNVSRPHLVKLLEQETIPFHKVGTHRRIYLEDLLAHIQENDEARSKTLDELAALSQDLGLY
ncbi:MAG: excisionase family DNA binding protein [Cellvibrionaceae bacterium]|jgi:excisionase family DNA binding protein